MVNEFLITSLHYIIVWKTRINANIMLWYSEVNKTSRLAPFSCPYVLNTCMKLKLNHFSTISFFKVNNEASTSNINLVQNNNKHSTNKSTRKVTMYFYLM